jgi:hypothetical protein
VPPHPHPLLLVSETQQETTQAELHAKQPNHYQLRDKDPEYSVETRCSRTICAFQTLLSQDDVKWKTNWGQRYHAAYGDLM